MMSKQGETQNLQLAFSLHRSGRYNEAAALYRKIIKRNPKNFHALHSLGVIEAANGNLKEAASLMARSLWIQPSTPQFIENYATVLCQMGDYKAALEACLKGLKVDSKSITLLYINAAALLQMGQLQESLEQFDKLIALENTHVAAIVERSTVLLAMKQFDAAADSIERALTLNPQYAEAYLNKGALCGHLERYDEALVALEKAVRLNPELTEAWLGYGNAFHALKRDDEALSAYDKALALKPDASKTWLVRGNSLVGLQRYDEAFAAYDRALAIEPELVGAWVGRGNCFREIEHYAEALGAYDKALSLKADLVQAWFARGAVFTKLRRHEEAAAAYAQVLKIDPQYPFTKGMLLHERMLCCDWEGLDEAIAEIDTDIASGKLSADPFGWQGLGRSQRSLQLCAELYNKTNFPADLRATARRAFANHDKIRIGYSSGELRDHATSHLIVGVLELHDNSRFEVYGVDNGWNDQSDMRRRIDAALHGIIDISKLSDSSAAAAIRENQIDILVNLNGYFGKQRMQVFAQRPAAIQVNYLGFPGTLGARYIDYIIADPHVIPEDQKVFYAEKVVYLPNCYQANDRRKEVGTHKFSRAECGLPENGFVFCCFNNNYKILPDTFNCWMRILKRVEDSVLWLLGDNRSAASHLRSAARGWGVNPDRLVFAKRMPLPDHLARHRLGGLFLDTLPYSAHTTASDALCAGLPLLTCVGGTFAGRVGASLLNAISLPELITTTLEDYERIAIELATNPGKLAKIRQRLDDNRLTTPLFDTTLFTKHIEAAYTTMYEREQAGLSPDHFSVPK
jgi:protein O-GlcNAc transferase